MSEDQKYLYRPLYGPAHFAALPKGLKWDYVEAPKVEPHIATRRGLPLSRHQFGVIACDHRLTPDELRDFDLEPHGITVEDIKVWAKLELGMASVYDPCASVVYQEQDNGKIEILSELLKWIEDREKKAEK